MRPLFAPAFGVGVEFTAFSALLEHAKLASATVVVVLAPRPSVGSMALLRGLPSPLCSGGGPCDVSADARPAPWCTRKRSDALLFPLDLGFLPTLSRRGFLCSSRRSFAALSRPLQDHDLFRAMRARGGPMFFLERPINAVFLSPAPALRPRQIGSVSERNDAPQGARISLARHLPRLPRSVMGHHRSPSSKRPPTLLQGQYCGSVMTRSRSAQECGTRSIVRRSMHSY